MEKASLNQVRASYFEDGQEQSDHLIINMWLDENGIPLRNQQMLGLSYEWNEKDYDIFPFVDRTGSGCFDFGGCAGDEGEGCRYYRTNILSKKIVVNEYFTVTCEGKEYTYKVTHVALLTN